MPKETLCSVAVARYKPEEGDTIEQIQEQIGATINGVIAQMLAAGPMMPGAQGRKVTLISVSHNIIEVAGEHVISIALVMEPQGPANITVPLLRMGHG